MQRYAAANEAQSEWTTPRTNKTVWWGGGQHFLEQNLEKRGKAWIFLVVPFERPKTTFLITFSQEFNFLVFFVFFFSTVESHYG